MPSMRSAVATSGSDAPTAFCTHALHTAYCSATHATQRQDVHMHRPLCSTGRGAAPAAAPRRSGGPHRVATARLAARRRTPPTKLGCNSAAAMMLARRSLWQWRMQRRRVKATRESSASSAAVTLCGRVDAAHACPISHSHLQAHCLRVLRLPA